MVKLGDSLHKHNISGNCCQAAGDIGKMFVVGFGKKSDGSSGIYKPTYNGNTAQTLESLNLHRRNFLKKYLGKEYEIMKSCQQQQPLAVLEDIGLSC